VIYVRVIQVQVIHVPPQYSLGQSVPPPEIQSTCLLYRARRRRQDFRIGIRPRRQRLQLLNFFRKFGKRMPVFRPQTGFRIHVEIMPQPRRRFVKDALKNRERCYSRQEKFLASLGSPWPEY